MTRQRHAFRRAAALAAVAVAATALGVHGAAASSPDDTAAAEAVEPQGTVRIAALVDRQTYDPHNSEIGHMVQYLQPVYDTLLRMTPSGEIVPMLAESWEYVDDTNTTLEFKLRDDVTFHDGEQFNADVVKANLERGLESTGPRAALIDSIESVEVIDDTTVQLHLSQPDPMMLLEMTSVMAMMISPAALDNENLDVVPVGSGPYLYDESASTPGDLYVYHANPDYWDPSIARAQNIEMRVMTDAEARLNAVIAGQADMAAGTNLQVEKAEAAGVEVLTQQVGWVGFSLADRDGTQVPALGDVRVRQAMNYAIDREAILNAVEQGRGIRNTQIFPPGSPSITDEIMEMYPYDPDMARELLAEAGYEDGFSIPVTTNARRQTFVEAVAGYLAEVGITLEIELIDAGFIETWLDGNHPMPNVIFGGRHPFEMSNLFLLPDSSFNPYGTNDPKVIELYEAAVAETDEAAMMEKFAELSKYVTEQAWFLVVFFEDAAYFVGERVSGVELYPNQVVPSIYGWSAES